MKRVLIISTLYSQFQHVRSILLRSADQYQFCGTADNSVLGMSMIESTRPDLVIMPAHMSFWNAEDLINYLLPRGIAPCFILMHEPDEPVQLGEATAQVSVLLPNTMPSEGQLLQALAQAAERQTMRNADTRTRQPRNPAVQHSLEVTELLMGLSPLQVGEAQQKFGRLRVGRQNCWLLLGAPAEEQDFQFYAQVELLDALLRAIPGLLAPLGACEVCIYRENNLCILLAGGQPTEPDWGVWTQTLNSLLQRYGIPALLYEISDIPLPLDRWHSQCRELLQLRQNRFFFSPPYLQPSAVSRYREPISQQQLHAHLSALSVAMHGLRRMQALEELDHLEQMVSHSLSMELAAYAMSQMVVQYNDLCYSFGIHGGSGDLSFSLNRQKSVAQVFGLYRQGLMELLDRLGSFSSSSNKIITDVCSYINRKLDERLTLESVASQVHVNATYLSRLFKRETGTNFNDYINQVRVQRAMQLLESGRRITDIAGMVGFDNAKYFSQVFKKRVGMTPQEYRQMRKGEKTP